jgi:SAM-dependent methyltransferase
MLPAGSFADPGPVADGYPEPAMAISGALHDAVMAPVERRGLAAQRALLVAGARGRVLEVGAGAGRDLPHYAAVAAVTSLVALESDRRRLPRLAARAARLALPVEIVAGGVPGSGLGEDSFDTVVCPFVLCRVPDPPGALGELRRLLRDDGQLLFLEPIIGRRWAAARIQRLVAPAWARVAGGCRVDRDTVAALRTAEFAVSDCERLAPLGRFTVGTVVRGRAIKRRRT